MPIRSKADLRTALTAAIHANTTGAITPAVHHALLTDIIDSSAAGAGSPARDRLQWHPVSGWTPVSADNTQFLVVTPENHFPALQAALVAHLTAGGNENDLHGLPAFVSTRLSSYVSIGGSATSGNDALLADLWPVGDDPPFLWLVSPVAFDWLTLSRVNASTRLDNAATGQIVESMQSFTRVAWTLTINDVPYEIGRYHTQLQRPVDLQPTPDQAALRFQFRYAAPAPSAPVVVQVL